MANRWGWGEAGDAETVVVNGRTIRCFCNDAGVESTITERIGRAYDTTDPEEVRAMQRRLEIMVVAKALGVTEDEVIAAVGGHKEGDP